jgi:hypothetical protein
MFSHLRVSWRVSEEPNFFGTSSGFGRDEKK